MTVQERARRNLIPFLLLCLCVSSHANRATAATELKSVEVGYAAEQPGKQAPRREAAFPAPSAPHAFGFDANLPQEVEPNGTTGTATPLSGTSGRVFGNVFPSDDVDYYSFTAAAGDRFYAATQTSFDSSGNGDSELQVIGTDGTSVLEVDEDDGSLNARSSSIAGVVLPSAGMYFLRVTHVFHGTIGSYQVFYALQSGSPAAEVESNNAIASAQPLPASGWVSGTVVAKFPERDLFSLTLAAGDSVFLSLDTNPARDNNTWDGLLGFGLFGNPPASGFLFVDDLNPSASEAFFVTVLEAGTYYAWVGSNETTGLGPNATYNLSVRVIPAIPGGANCTTYTSTDVPKAIPSGPGMVSSTLTVPGNPRIEDLDVSIRLTHTFVRDLDVQLMSPAGNVNGLFSDIGANSTGSQNVIVRLDDEAAVPPAFTSMAGMVYQPELNYRLSWFDGENAGGTWSLVLRDDNAGDGGTLESWSITVCEPPPPPACPPLHVPTTVFTSDFEAGDAGFTHSGNWDEWERGLPAFAPLTTCNSGVNCWKTDLDGTYNARSSQDLVSPTIDLSGVVPPITAMWAQRYQMQLAGYDNFSVKAHEVGTPNNAVLLFEWLDATMTDTVGNPEVVIAESSGWSLKTTDISALAGRTAELRFHLDSWLTGQLAGVAIDDVSVVGCRPIGAELAISNTDGVGSVLAGGSVTYTIAASNTGPNAAAATAIDDTFPTSLTCNWACVGAGGGTCTASGSGDLHDTANLPAGGSAIYTASCTVASSASGSLVNTATVSSFLNDSNTSNNSATDTTLVIAHTPTPTSTPTRTMTPTPTQTPTVSSTPTQPPATTSTPTQPPATTSTPIQTLPPTRTPTLGPICPDPLQPCGTRVSADILSTHVLVLFAIVGAGLVFRRRGSTR